MSGLKLSKGQTFMPDFMASLVVFGVILAIFLSAWNAVLSHQTGFEQEYLSGQQTMSFLVSTPGYPEDWNASNIQVPGFAGPDQVLQEEKLEEFGEIEYDRQRHLLQAPEFYMVVEEGNDIVYEYGQSYSEAENVIPFSRTVHINRTGNLSTAEMRYIVWN